MTNWFHRSFFDCMAKSLALTLAIVLAAPAYAGVAGEVVLATGEVWKVSDSGKQALERGHSLNEGDTIETGKGQLIVRMVDGGLLSVRDNSKATISDYRAKQPDQPAAVRITIDQGVVRSSTGSIGESDKSKFRVNTPFSALGVRGTDFVTSVRSGVQQVYVVSGEIGLSPFGVGCQASGFGECAKAVALPASPEQSLKLVKGQPAALRLASVAAELLPVEAESTYFQEAVAGLFGESPTQASSSYSSAKVYAADGSEIKPFDTSVSRAVYDRSTNDAVEQRPVSNRELTGVDYGQLVTDDEIDRISEGLLLNRESGDTDGDGLADFVELQLNLNPWGQDTDKDGLIDSVDLSPRTAKSQYWFDGQASPVSEDVMRFALRDVSNTLSSFELGDFGFAAFYRARSSASGSLSMWLDPAHGQLWGQRNVLSTLLSVRQFPEGSTIWGGLPKQASHLGEGAQAWLEGVASGRQALNNISLADQAILFNPGGRESELNPMAGGFSLSFVQQLQPASFGGGPLRIFQAPKFLGLKRDGESFELTYQIAGVSHTLVGSAGAGGVFFAADDEMSVRGVKTGNSVLLMVSDNNQFQQWMLGYSLSDERAGPIVTNLVSSTTDQGVTWGRWQNFANLKQEDVEALLGPDVIANSRFALVAKAAQNLPQSGRFEFILRDHEAVYSKDTVLMPADVSNSFLQVDFGQKRFSTTFDVTAPGVSATNIRGAGEVTSSGLMLGDKGLSNAQLVGVLANQGRAASLLFEKTVGENEVFSGVTHWSR